MSIHSLKQLSTQTTQNEFGETPLPFSPKVTLANGTCVVPQQYLDVARNLSNLEAIIECITYSDQYLVFAGEINGVLYLQVGVIGTENYPNKTTQQNEVKIVYGRRWLIEPTTTTSEVVQTVMLAIKKAREHELREKVTKTINGGTNKTTPFNSHMDLPQMAGNASLFSPIAQTLQQQIDELVGTIKISSFNLKVHKLHSLDQERALLELDLVSCNKPETHFSEMAGQRLSLLCNNSSSTELLHNLISQVIQISDRHIEDNLMFNGFARFSHSIPVGKIAEFSYQSRNIDNKDPRFAEYFKDMSYRVDSTKAPPFATGQLGDKQRAALAKYAVNAGYEPEAVMHDRSSHDLKRKQNLKRLG